ncbi:glycosyltransferase family 2 protein [Kineosporia rhizophila]|uniref:glycosyltransferase n=1 Tax=Kineosporia TaxID=49184 RepID=UPI001E5E0D9B|nr:glycosyltransferase [Kineosporia sp. NBRC 101677]MCE0539092.1 glycosyltransferase family 2 protein [Kineosporia rhizophila]
MRPGGLVVVVPAKDEEDLVPACLEAVITAVTGIRIPTAIVLVAHRCQDATEAVARRAFSNLPRLVEGLVVPVATGTVATARATGTMAGLGELAAYGIPFEQTWLLSTDADSVVPADWVRRYLPYLGSGAAGVTGMVRVNGWEAGPPLVSSRTSEAYRRIVTAGLHVNGHDHVYGANLAVRADAYLEVGGWPEQVPGEDAALIAAVRRRGFRVVSAPEVVVTTSGRTQARAPGGLGALLGRIVADHSSTPHPAGGRNARIIPRQALRSRS